VRIAVVAAGLMAAVVRSSRALPAARNNAAPRGAAAIEAVAGPVRASPLSDASAIPDTGWYDETAGASCALGRCDVAACDVGACDVAACDVAGFDVAGFNVAAAVVVDCPGGAGADVIWREFGLAVSRVVECGEAAGAAPAGAGGRVCAAGVGAGVGAGVAAEAAGIRRTTGDDSTGVAVRAAAAAAADGAAGSQRFDVAAATVSAGPVTRRRPAGRAGAATGDVSAGTCAPARSRVDINGSGPPSPRAAVSPGAVVRAAGAEPAMSAGVSATGCADGEAAEVERIDRRATGPAAAPAAAALSAADGAT
jgi:hypothetical protein